MANLFYSEPNYLVDPEEEREAAKERLRFERCTPERLLAFMERIGHIPTLIECKKEFGGIIGPMMDGWELQRQKKWPTHLKKIRRA